MLVSVFLVAFAQIILEAPLLIPVLIGIGCVVYYTNDEKIRSFMRASSDESDEDPLAVARNQYARGELTEAEFERKVDRLLDTETVEEGGEYRADEPLTERT